MSERGLPDPRRCLSARPHSPRHRPVYLSPRRGSPSDISGSVSGFVLGDRATTKCPGPLCLRWALPIARMISWIISEGITLPSSLIRTHAPDQQPPNVSGCPSYARSLQVAASPCWLLAFPDIISITFVKVSGPVPRRVRQVPLPISSSATAASRQEPRVRHTEFPCNATSTGRSISGLQSFDYLRTPPLARPSDRTHLGLRPGSRAVYATHRLGSCLSQDVVSLRA